MTNFAGYSSYQYWHHYHLAKHRNAAFTALQLGHADANMLFAHYRELVRPADATRYWELRPRAALRERSR